MVSNSTAIGRLHACTDGFERLDLLAPLIARQTVTHTSSDTECVCFDQQLLDGQSGAEMPLQFIVDQDLPADIHTITLSYTLFDVTGTVTDGLASR